MPHFLIELVLDGPLPESDLLAQRAFVADLTNSGRLIISGVRLDRPGHGLAVLEAASLEAALAAYRAAPVIAAGLADFTAAPFRITGGSAAG
jgi:uncharacterized protein YciI